VRIRCPLSGDRQTVVFDGIPRARWCACSEWPEGGLRHSVALVAPPRPPLTPSAPHSLTPSLPHLTHSHSHTHLTPSLFCTSPTELHSHSGAPVQSVNLVLVSPAPLTSSHKMVLEVVRSEIKSLDFGIYSDAEMRQLSCCKISSSVAYDTLGNAIIGYDGDGQLRDAYESPS
jgi:hypothetical protein